MATISIIILLALLFYLFYFSERMKRIREIVARPIIGLTIIAGSVSKSVSVQAPSDSSDMQI